MRSLLSDMAISSIFCAWDVWIDVHTHGLMDYYSTVPVANKKPEADAQRSCNIFDIWTKPDPEAHKVHKRSVVPDESVHDIQRHLTHHPPIVLSIPVRDTCPDLRLR